MNNDTKPALPEPWDYCYEWDGPYGSRKFSAAKHNGNSPDRSVPIYTAGQMHAYGQSCADAAIEQCAEVCEEVEASAWALWKMGADPIEQGRNIGAQHCADALRALKGQPT